MSFDIAIVRCPDYRTENTKVAVEEAFNLLNITSDFFSPEDQTLIKLNLLSKRPPDERWDAFRIFGKPRA